MVELAKEGGTLESEQLAHCQFRRFSSFDGECVE